MRRCDFCEDRNDDDGWIQIGLSNGEIYDLCSVECVLRWFKAELSGKEVGEIRGRGVQLIVHQEGIDAIAS